MTVGDIVPNGRGKWKLVAPTHCANGHTLPGNVSVGTSPCDCGHRHTEWFCRTCKHITYGPPLSDRCRIRTGPDER